MSKLYEIVKVTPTEIFVVVTTTQNTNSFWSDLQMELQSIARNNVTVYFDFVLRHGLANRFFETMYSGRVLRLGIRKTLKSELLIRLFNQYFAKRSELISQSLMSKREQEIFLSHL